jgi:CRISPR system Cascade subunit CasB
MSSEADLKGEQSPASGDQVPDRHERPLAAVIGRIAAAVQRELSAGDVAALRRLTPEDPGVPAFWKVAAAHLEGALPAGGEARDEAERRWATVLSGMALTSGLHARGRRAGAALADAGYSELRFERLLRAKGDALLHEVRTAARFVASKAAALDWTELATLVLGAGGDSDDGIRRSLARSYYAQLSRNEDRR